MGEKCNGVTLQTKHRSHVSEDGMVAGRNLRPNNHRVTGDGALINPGHSLIKRCRTMLPFICMGQLSSAKLLWVTSMTTDVNKLCRHTVFTQFCPHSPMSVVRAISFMDTIYQLKSVIFWVFLSGYYINCAACLCVYNQFTEITYALFTVTVRSIIKVMRQSQINQTQ